MSKVEQKSKAASLNSGDATKMSSGQQKKIIDQIHIVVRLKLTDLVQTSENSDPEQDSITKDIQSVFVSPVLSFLLTSNLQSPSLQRSKDSQGLQGNLVQRKRREPRKASKELNLSLEALNCLLSL
ncbi:hypothetical protein U0070_025809 [Myodes glareolus]|uniref:Uncharacterized protein n=1 Tax=Myodes glareolus TaxID=447135 RepID=A0AAW0J884_MYOGA